MYFPSPLPLICALLLCLPLAFIFTINIVDKFSPENSHIIFIPTSDIPKTHQKINLQPEISPPPQLDDDDSPLLAAAAKVNSNPSPRSVPKKIAFMFLTTAPLPFASLWELYFNKTPPDLYNIYIHADPNYNYSSPFSGVFANRVIRSKPALRFTPTLASAARRLLAHALLHDSANYMFAIFSPSCIPLHSFNFTYNTLMGSNKSFIEILRNDKGTYDRWAARGYDAMLPEVNLEDFRTGSQFWVLTRKHARIIASDNKIWSKFNVPCRRWDTCYPEENYFPTLISMMDPGGYIPLTLTSVEWKRPNYGHPRMYEVSEVDPGLVLKLRKGKPKYADDGTDGSDSSVRKRVYPFLFARKIHPDANTQLMSIASDVIFKD